MGILTSTPLQAQKDRLAGVSSSDSARIVSLQKVSRAYADAKDYNSAIVFVRQAIDALAPVAHNPSANIKALVSDYYSLADYYDKLGQIPAKMKTLDNMIALCREHKYISKLSLYCLWERTKYLYNTGDFRRCSDYAALGEEDALNSIDTAHYYNNFLLDHVNSELGLNNYASAEALLHGQVDRARVAAPEYLWRLYIQLAQVEVAKKNFERSILYYNQAFQAARTGGEDLGCLQSLENTGYYVYFTGYHDGNKALAYYRKALAYVGKCREPAIQIALESLNLLTNIANVYASAGRYDSAIRYYQQAFDQLGHDMNEQKLSHSLLGSVVEFDRAWYLTALMIDRGDAWLRQYKTTRLGSDLRQAIGLYNSADKVLDKFKSEQADITSRLFWRSDSRRLYEHAIEACYLDNKNIKDAFYFFEKGRSVLLNDQLNEQNFLSNREIAQQARWKKNIYAVRRQLEDPSLGTDGREALMTELLQVQQRFDSMKASARRLTDTGFIGLRDVRDKLLRDHQALLELFAGDSSVYTLLITPRHQSLGRIGKASFDSAAKLYIYYLSNPAATNKDMNGYRRAARRLYRLIFGDNDLPPGRIIISPDGQYFPFEALITDEDPSGVTHNDPSPDPVYFIRDHAASYTYSARYLLNNTAGSSAESVSSGDTTGSVGNSGGGPATATSTAGSNGVASGSFMGIAPVQYSAYLDLPSLPGSNNSLDRIGCHFRDPKIFLSKQASRNNFLTQFAKYKIIQLDTHAAGNTLVNSEPVIYFADSALTLSDLIAEERPLTRLIVLSACETGNGKVYQGEGVFSFNREFAALGIPSSIINLWAVDNESTYRQTELFYNYLSEGLPADLAMQKAKLEFLQTASKEKSLPYYWAASVLAGSSESIPFEKPFSWLRIVWAGWLLLASALFLWVWWYRRQRINEPA